MLTRWFGFLVGVFLPLGFPACTELGPDLSTCSETVAVNVSPGVSLGWTPAPDFSWTPACPVERLTVTDVETGAAVWGAISMNQSNNIAPPVRYATTPDGAALTANRLEPLVPGATYRVELFRIDDGRDGTDQPLGVATFIP